MTTRLPIGLSLILETVMIIRVSNNPPPDLLQTAYIRASKEYGEVVIASQISFKPPRNQISIRLFRSRQAKPGNTDASGARSLHPTSSLINVKVDYDPNLYPKRGEPIILTLKHAHAAPQTPTLSTLLFRGMLIVSPPAI